MKTKYDVGDKVLIEAKIESIKIESFSDIRYFLKVKNGGCDIVIAQAEKMIKGKEEVDE